ncbi:hypothetical protein EGW08_016933 [Elysia chlorotica]|uniref:Uncharacterized protein n=1 Tax=Elysia chlorotica TaxID=188477 RepID=A0A3S1B598_ELYCH|nr:hypothetical protein EGW08_016933 [Elysia chlorotica]
MRKTFRLKPGIRTTMKPTLTTVSQMVEWKADKKLIRAHVEEATDKVIIMKDIHNVSKRLSLTQQPHSETVLESMPKYTENNLLGVSMHEKHNGDNEVTSIYTR